MLLNCIISVITTLCFDYVRDMRCKRLNDCCNSTTLESKPNYVLDENWKVVLLSYNYAMFYGYICSFALPQYIINSTVGYFICISFLQRFMCVCVMNGIHRNTSPVVHACYYLLYFLGSSLAFDEGNWEYGLISVLSVVSSVIFIHLNHDQYNYSWQEQYDKGKLVTVQLYDRNNPFYSQPYSKFEYYHLRLILLGNFILLGLNYDKINPYSIYTSVSFSYIMIYIMEKVSRIYIYE